ncbi:MAG: ribonuclease H-like domain-containing protein [Gammaproteobacteria bacterium]|nr:ribonuclease H-like domain-containing protein [Gammaproteobacteria bacterium]
MSSLADRLGALRRQAGAAVDTVGPPANQHGRLSTAGSSAGPSAPEPLDPDPSRWTPAFAEPTNTASPAPAACLARLRAEMDRLLAVGRTGAPSARRGLSDEALAGQLGGTVVAEGLIGVEHRTPLPVPHGRWRLAGDLPGHLEVLGLPHADPLLLDTETTGLAGGTGTTAFLVGLARLEGGALLVRQYLLTRFGGEPALLRAVADFGRGAGTLVSFNGKSFDLPLLAARYRLAGQPDPFQGWPHADLLHPVRRAFARRWDDCRMATLEDRLLGFTRPTDLPSAEVPEVWLRWLRHRDPGRLPLVLDHNRWDLVSLAALLSALAAAYAAPERHGADPLAVARHRGAREGPASARALLAASRARLDTRGLHELARLARRDGDGTLAVEVWTELADRGDTRALEARALEALAKHAEHAERDPVRARRLTERLLSLEPRSLAHRQRAARIDRALARRSSCPECQPGRTP